MLIRGETPADIPAIHELVTRVFDRDGEARLIDDLRKSGNLSLSLIAEDNDIVGHVGSVP